MNGICSIRFIFFLFALFQLKNVPPKMGAKHFGNGFPMFLASLSPKLIQIRTIRILMLHGIFAAIKSNSKSYMPIFCCTSCFFIVPSFEAIICYHFVAFDRWIDDVDIFFLSVTRCNRYSSHANSAEKKSNSWRNKSRNRRKLQCVTKVLFRYCFCMHKKSVMFVLLQHNFLTLNTTHALTHVHEHSFCVVTWHFFCVFCFLFGWQHLFCYSISHSTLIYLALDFRGWSKCFCCLHEKDWAHSIIGKWFLKATETPLKRTLKSVTSKLKLNVHNILPMKAGRFFLLRMKSVRHSSKMIQSNSSIWIFYLICFAEAVFHYCPCIKMLRRSFHSTLVSLRYKRSLLSKHNFLTHAISSLFLAHIRAIFLCFAVISLVDDIFPSFCLHFFISVVVFMFSFHFFGFVL